MPILKLILPRNGVMLSIKYGEHVYFLAGPIRGGDDWQAKAIKLLHEKDPNCYIVCPCRYGKNHELFEYSLEPTEAPHELIFPNQTMWERYYLEAASQLGAIIFWLPEESTLNPRKKEDGPYARDTYGELGRWSIISSGAQYSAGQLKANLIIGAEKNFPGLSVIQKNFDADHGRTFPIYLSLEETIHQSVKLAKK